MLKKILIVSFFLMSIMMLSAQTAFAAQADYDSEGYPEFVTTVNLRLRSGPSTNHSILSLLHTGTIIQVTDYVPATPQNHYAFSAVLFGETSGYVASRYITPRTSQSQPAPPVMAAPAAAASVPASTGNVELLNWSYVRQIMPTGTNIRIFDIRSGLTYYVRNFSNGNHADVETIDRANTDTMRATSGGYSWNARPVLATFNGRTVAASIHTRPHAGYTISGNGMNGHICLHFLGSSPHNGNRTWEAEMQAAVRQAYNFGR